MIYFLWYVAFSFLMSMFLFWKDMEHYKNEPTYKICLLILVCPIIPPLVVFECISMVADRLFIDDK